MKSSVRALQTRGAHDISGVERAAIRRNNEYLKFEMFEPANLIKIGLFFLLPLYGIYSLYMNEMVC